MHGAQRIVMAQIRRARKYHPPLVNLHQAKIQRFGNGRRRETAVQQPPKHLNPRQLPHLRQRYQLKIFSHLHGNLHLQFPPTIPQPFPIHN